MHDPESYEGLAGLHPSAGWARSATSSTAILYLERATFVTGEILHVVRARLQEQPRLLRPDGRSRGGDLPRLHTRGLRRAPPLRSPAPIRARPHGRGAAGALATSERLGHLASEWTRGVRRGLGRAGERPLGRRARALRARAGGDETPEALEGLSWAAWWLDDADGRVRRPRARLPPLPAARRRGRRGAHGDLARGRPARLPRRVAGGERLARSARTACSTRSSPGPSTAGSPSTRATSPTRAATPRRRASELAAARPSSGGGSASPTSRCSGSRSRARRSSRCAQVEEGMRCLDEATATALEGEATIPISGAWACCFLVTACTAVLDYERAFEWCDRIAEFAERYGSRYMLAFCRAEYGAVHLWRGRWARGRGDARGLGRGLLALAPGVGRRRRWSGWPSCGGGRAGAAEAARLLDQAGAVVDGAALPGPARARPRRRRSGPSSLPSGCCASCPRDRELDRAPALELLVRARIARGELEEARRGARGAARDRAAVGTRAAARLRRPRRGDARGRAAATTSGPARCSRTRSIASSEAARRSRPRRRGSSSRRSLRRARSQRCGRAGGDAPRSIGSSSSAPRRRRSAPRDSLDASRRAATARAPPELTPREREVLRLLAEGLTNRQIAERLVVSEHTVHRHVTNILRKLDLPSRTAAAALAVRAGPARRPSDSQIWPCPAEREDGRFWRSRGPSRRLRSRAWSVGSTAATMAEAAALARIERDGERGDATRRDSRRRASRAQGRRRGRCGRSATTTGSRRRRSGSSGRCWSRRAGSPPASACSTSRPGPGNVAIRAAEAGAEVVASDLTPENFDAGRREAARTGVELEWVEADAEALPFADGEFDVVTSSFGAIFAPDHQRSPTSCCASAGRRHDRDDQLHARGPRRRVLRRARAVHAAAATRALPPLPVGQRGARARAVRRPHRGARTSSARRTPAAAAAQHAYVGSVTHTFGDPPSRSAPRSPTTGRRVRPLIFLAFATRANTGAAGGPRSTCSSPPASCRRRASEQRQQPPWHRSPHHASGSAARLIRRSRGGVLRARQAPAIAPMTAGSAKLYAS